MTSDQIVFLEEVQREAVNDAAKLVAEGADPARRELDDDAILDGSELGRRAGSLGLVQEARDTYVAAWVAECARLAAARAVADRIARLELTDISEGRLKSLTLAHEAGVGDATFTTLANATRLSRTDTIVLPAHRYEGLSRGKGWARKGRANKAEWGARDDGGYRVGPGAWTVGGSDGFSRKGETKWTVKHISVGGATWTIAD